MGTRSTLSVGTALIVLAASHGPTLGARGGPRGKDAIRAADIIFAGRPAEIVRDGNGHYRCLFKVVACWKGEVGDTITLSGGRETACTYQFCEGNTYLVYLREVPGKPRVSAACMGVGAVEMELADRFRLGRPRHQFGEGLAVITSDSLLWMLATPSPTTWMVVDALRELPEFADLFLPALVQMAQGYRPGDQRIALLAIEALGVAAANVTDALMTMYRSPAHYGTSIRAKALQVAIRTNADALRFRQEIVACLSDSAPVMKSVGAIYAHRVIESTTGDSRRRLTARLLACLEHPDSGVRIHAIIGLRFAKADRRVRAKVTALAETDPDGGVRTFAQRFLACPLKSNDPCCVSP